VRAAQARQRRFSSAVAGRRGIAVEFGLPAGRYSGGYPWRRREGRYPRLVALAAAPRLHPSPV